LPADSAKPVGVGAAFQPWVPTGEGSGLCDRDVRGLQSLRTFDHIELHLRAFRFKHDFEPMGKASEGILALEPVTFHYKSDSANIPQFGLIAEEVEKWIPT